MRQFDLSSWPEELVNQFKLLLKGGRVTRLEDLKHKAYGAIGGRIIFI